MNGNGVGLIDRLYVSYVEARLFDQAREIVAAREKGKSEEEILAEFPEPAGARVSSDLPTVAIPMNGRILHNVPPVQPTLPAKLENFGVVVLNDIGLVPGVQLIGYVRYITRVGKETDKHNFVPGQAVQFEIPSDATAIKLVVVMHYRGYSPSVSIENDEAGEAITATSQVALSNGKLAKVLAMVPEIDAEIVRREKDLADARAEELIVVRRGDLEKLIQQALTLAGPNAVPINTDTLYALRKAAQAVDYQAKHQPAEKKPHVPTPASLLCNM